MHGISNTMSEDKLRWPNKESINDRLPEFNLKVASESEWKRVGSTTCS
jgi:hypothetical protein